MDLCFYMPLRHRFIKIKCEDGGSYSQRNKKYGPLEIENIVLSVFFISEIPKGTFT